MVIIQIISVALIAFILRSALKFLIFTYKVKVNKLAYLLAGILCTLLPAFISPSTVSIVYLILTSLGLAFILLYFDEKGWGGSKAVLEKKTKKNVIRPKAKPNRIKYLSDAEKEKLIRKTKKK